MSPARHASDEQMDAATWCRHLVADRSVDAFRAGHRHQLFPSEAFGDLTRQGRTHPAVLAQVVASVMVLALEGLSNQQAWTPSSSRWVHPSMTAMGVAKGTAASAAEVLLGYPSAIVACSASALLPKPYGMRGGYRAVFTEGAIESSWTAGYDGRPTTTLTEYTEQGQREVDLAARDAYAAVIDHVIACCQGRETSRLSPASVLDTLQLTFDVHTALAAPKRP